MSHSRRSTRLFVPAPMLRPLLPLLLGSGLTLLAEPSTPIVIAHRGASGYLPEHTLESAAYAHALGADFIEQDVVLSRDDVLVVTHDIHLETTTDVAERHPSRHRPDGRWYAIDFSWDELRQLKVRERFEPRTGKPVFPKRFPHQSDSAFRLCTLDEQIRLIQGLNRSTGRNAGIYVEFKAPAWHAAEGRDLGAALLAELRRHGFSHREDPVFVQCFDPAALRTLRTVHRTELRLIQLLGENAWNEAPADYTAMQTEEGLRDIATYATGIGPNLGQILRAGTGGVAEVTPLIAAAHRLGLLVHPYTLRADALPPGVPGIDVLLELVLRRAQADGVFIDQPDAAVRFVRRLGDRKAPAESASPRTP